MDTIVVLDRDNIEVQIEKDIWEQEYSKLNIIPSSSRREPSKALKIVNALLPLHGRIFEPGCGNGRNSIFLAKFGCEVYSMDFSVTALDILKKYAIKEKVSNKIHIYNKSVLDPLQFEDEFFDFVLDSYTFCHFLNENKKDKYFKELSRIVKRDGFLIFICLSTEDEYYSDMIINKTNNVWTINDPNNNVRKNLYTEDGIKKLLETYFKTVHLIKHEFTDIVLGKKYIRSILTIIVRNSGKEEGNGLFNEQSK